MMRQRGFTMLELVLVIIIISVLVSVALKRLLPLIDEAERASVLRLEGELRSTLVMEAAERVVRGQSASITELQGSNPIKFLAEPPKNYLGELTDRERAEAPRRHWYFETENRRLVYRLGDAFSTQNETERREDPAFTVRVLFGDNDRNGTFDVAGDDFHGVHLARVAGADWLQGASVN